MATKREREHGWEVRFGRRTKSKDYRKTIIIGHVSVKDASAAVAHIEHLYESQQADTPVQLVTRKWLQSLPNALHAKISEKGLCSPRENTSGNDWFLQQSDEVRARICKHELRKEAAGFLDPCDTVSQLCDHFLVWKVRDGRAEGSIVVYRRAIRLLKHFFRNMELTAVTKARMDDFISWVYREGKYDKKRKKFGKPLAKTTASRMVRNCKSIFKRAADHEWIDAGAFYRMFLDAPKGTRSNKSRQVNIREDTIQRVIEHGALNNEQKLLFALAYYCMPRIPSELLPLTWSSVDWEREMLLLRSPKQQGHDWKYQRWVPIWPEVRPYLDAPFFADSDSQFVFRRYRSGGSAQHRSLLVRACHRAGITASRDEKPWEKVWMNMRSTRETQLRLKHPADIVNYWMNHNEDISRNHYQQVEQWAEYDWRTASIG